MYGLSQDDFTSIDSKLIKQEKYIKNMFFNFGIENEQKSILDFTYSANLNPNKYFAEMNNRINSIFKYANEKKLKPVFCTITAPSKYHQTDKNRKLILSPNQTAKDLTQTFNKFTNIQVFQKLRKELGKSLTYFRVNEPHKSGVPHTHIMLFLPNHYILEVKQKFYEYFTNKVRWGNNVKSLDFRYTFYNVKGAISYLMKYITKTFKNENNSKNKAWYWYIKNNVRRFSCSRTLAPLMVYRKIRYFFKDKYQDDYLEISKLLKEKNILRLFDDTTYNYMFYNKSTGEIEEINIWQKNTDLILRSRIKKDKIISLKYSKKEFKTNLIAFVSDFEKYIYSKKMNKFILMPVIPSLLSDYQLNNYFNILNKNIDNINLIHFGITKNEMIKRGFLQEDYINPALYTPILGEYNEFS
ncbi:replication endonuclease [Aliarcobacter lanthieri]|uniref:replication endonuclease n=1 Tax=Aliarcobacter lanthieri TaxID=1355374 RepID=UPI003AAE3B6F